MGERVDRGDRRLAQFRRALPAPDRMVDAADDVRAPGDLRVFDAEAGEPRAACRSTRKPATLVVPRSTARPSVAGGAAKSRSARRSRDMRAHRPIAVAQSRRQLPRRGEIDCGRAAAAARGSRGRGRTRISASVACGTLMSRLDHGRIERQNSTASPPSNSARTTGASERGAISIVQSDCGDDLAGAHPARLFLGRRQPRARRPSSTSPATIRTAAGAARAASAAGADDAHAVAPRALERSSRPAAVDVAVQLGEGSVKLLPPVCRWLMARAQTRRPAAAARPDIRQLRRRRAIVASRPMRRRQIDADTQHHRHRFERMQGLAGRHAARRSSPAPARRSTAALCRAAGPDRPRRNSPAAVKPALARFDDDAVLHAAGERGQQFVAQFVERERQRHAPFRKQRARPAVRAPARA